MTNAIRTTMLIAVLGAVSATPLAHAQDMVRVADEGGIRDEWTLSPGAKLLVPAYPPELASDQVEACVAIGYLVNPDGRTSDFALLKAWSARKPAQERERYWSAFARVASTALSQWSFAPKAGVEVARPVYTVGTFVFASPNMAESRKRCAIPNLSLHLLEIKRDTRSSRRKNALQVLDRLDIDPLLEARYRDSEYRYDTRLPRNGPELPAPIPKPSPVPPSGG